MKKKSQPRKRNKPPKWKAPLPGEIFDATHVEETRQRDLDMAERYRKWSESATADPYAAMSMWQLRDKALEGDEEALSLLRLRTWESVSALTSIAEKRPELLRPEARTSAIWPVFHSRASLVATQNEDLFDRIELGKEVATFGPNRHVVLTTRSPQKRWALHLFDLIFDLRNLFPYVKAIMRMGEPLKEIANHSDEKWEAMHLYQLHGFMALFGSKWPLPHRKYTFALLERCLQLPLLTDKKPVTDQYWSVALELFLLNTDNNPAQIADLNRISQAAAKHPSGLNSDGTYNANRVRDNVRAKILTDLKEEFSRIPKALLKAKKNGGAGEDVTVDWMKELEKRTQQQVHNIAEANAQAQKEYTETLEMVRELHAEGTNIAGRLEKRHIAEKGVTKEELNRLVARATSVLSALKNIGGLTSQYPQSE